MDWETRRNETPSELNLSQGASATQANASVALRRSLTKRRTEGILIEFDFLRISHYREAVLEYSPGLLRFAATLGTELWNSRNPNGVMTVLLATQPDTTPLGLLSFMTPFPRVAAKHGNPGL